MELEDYIKEQCGLVEKPVDETVTYKCPECGGEMLLRTNRQNDQKFWGCKKYPDCRGTRDSSGLSRAERDAEKKIVDVNQQSGFSFNRKR
jgi:ssDNA-binding Zn-finger/Zn-ribbon topoisomerase 1